MNVFSMAAHAKSDHESTLVDRGASCCMPSKHRCWVRNAPLRNINLESLPNTSCKDRYSVSSLWDALVSCICKYSRKGA